MDAVSLSINGLNLVRMRKETIFRRQSSAESISSEWKPGDEPYYPVNDEKNGALYAEYKKLADS